MIRCIQMEVQLPLSMSVYVWSTNSTKNLILKYNAIFAELALVKRNFQNILGLLILCYFGVQELLQEHWQWSSSLVLHWRSPSNKEIWILWYLHLPLRHVYNYLPFWFVNCKYIRFSVIPVFFFSQTLRRRRNVRTPIKDRNTEEQRAKPNLDEHVKPGVLRLLTHTVLFLQMNAWTVGTYSIIEYNWRGTN